jgi:deoxyribodipyrimidine photo-lyase
VPDVRIRALNAAPVNREGGYVLHWMTNFRRTRHNHALQRSVEWARELGKPLLVLEALRCGYRWASDRLHRFVLEGMADTAAALAGGPAHHYAYVERERGEGKGLLAALAAQACVVVTDDAPVFFLPRMLQAAVPQVPVRMEAVDANGLLPLHSTPRVFTTALSFRLHLRRHLAEHLQPGARPLADPLAGARLPALASLPRGVERRWPRATAALLAGEPAALAALPIDHAVPPVPTRGGMRAAEAALGAFVRERLPRYSEMRGEPAVVGTSRLSMYYHFAHLSPHGTLAALEALEGRPAAVKQERGGRHDLFGLMPEAEAYLDELVTWREISYHWDAKHPDPFSLGSLPQWAQRTLEKHRGDPRPGLERREALEAGTTRDPVYNAAQRQLRSEGWFHNAGRMVWGKKLLEYSESPEAALGLMADFMNRYSLDGRDPAANASFFWVLGRFDRAWGPERPIYGTVRYLATLTPTKLRHFRAYVAKYAEAPLTPAAAAPGAAEAPGPKTPGPKTPGPKTPGPKTPGPRAPRAEAPQEGAAAAATGPRAKAPRVEAPRVKAPREKAAAAAKAPGARRR